MSVSLARAELILLASPSLDDTYYQDVADDITAFHINYARLILENGDDVIILTNPSLYDEYANAIGDDKVVVAPMLDIWMRDFTLTNPKWPLLFRYTAAGQGGRQDYSDEVQDEFLSFIKGANLRFTETPLFNDGGNLVDDNVGNIVISNKFLKDNKIDEDKARVLLQSFAGINNVAFIDADEQGGLEHADGVVSFVDENTLMINSYPDDIAYSQKLKRDLRRGLPHLRIHEIITPYDDSVIYDDRFGSACGLYTNALVTPDRIYFPQFNIPEDKIALQQVKAITNREIVPVPSSLVCHMGGGVRCMSWQLRGDNARRLLQYIAMLKKQDG